jgi:serine/threonine protein kinase
MPYVAPEVLSGREYTPAVDIYGFGVIMAEISTGQRPFDGYDFNLELALKICDGLRPDEFALGTPDDYVKLARRCMDSDPDKRPTANDLSNYMDAWYEFVMIGSQPNVMWHSMYGNEDVVKKQYLEADEIVKELPIVTQKHPGHMYTSKLINTRVISKSIMDSKLQDLTIDDINLTDDDV